MNFSDLKKNYEYQFKSIFLYILFLDNFNFEALYFLKSAQFLTVFHQFNSQNIVVSFEYVGFWPKILFLQPSQLVFRKRKYSLTFISKVIFCKFLNAKMPTGLEGFGGPLLLIKFDISGPSLECKEQPVSSVKVKLSDLTME